MGARIQPCTEAARSRTAAAAATSREGATERIALRAGLDADTLYYVARAGKAAVAPSLRQLVRLHPEVRAEGLDLERLASLALAWPVDGGTRTVWRGIQRVPPAHELVVCGGATECVPLPPPDPIDVGATNEQCADALLDTLRAAIRRAIVGHERVAVLVGGGLDSSAVLTLVSHEASAAGVERIDAIAIDFPSPGDDRTHLVDLTGRLGLEPLRIAPASTAPLMLDALVADGAPFGWPSAAWELAAMRLASSRGNTVLLTGAGGDDLLDGAPIDDDAPIRPSTIVRAIVNARAFGTTSATPFARARLAREVGRALPAWRDRWRRARASRQIPAWAGPRARAWIRANAARGYDDHRSRIESILRSGHLAEVAEMRTQLVQLTGLARRDPFLDDEIVRLAGSLRPSQLGCDGIRRGLLRRAMRRLVDASVWQRSDKAEFEAALRATWRGAGDLQAIEGLVDAPEMTRLGLADGVAFRRAVERLAHGPADRGDWLGVWPALSVERFLFARAASNRLGDES